MSEAISGERVPHIAALMRATCWPSVRSTPRRTFVPPTTSQTSSWFRFLWWRFAQYGQTRDTFHLPGVIFQFASFV